MIRVGLQGKNLASIRFFKKWPRGFFVSPLVDNFDFDFQRFLVEQFVGIESHPVGLMTASVASRVRDWAKGHLVDVPDHEVLSIVHYFSQRVQGYLDLEEFVNAGHSVGISSGCDEHEMRVVDIDLAMAKLRVFRRLSLQEYGDEVYGRDHGFPPFSVNCTCRLESSS